MTDFETFAVKSFVTSSRINLLLIEQNNVHAVALASTQLALQTLLEKLDPDNLMIEQISSSVKLLSESIKSDREKIDNIESEMQELKVLVDKLASN